MFKKWPKNCQHRISVKAKLCFDGSVCGIERIPRHVLYISISYRSTLKCIEWLFNCWLKSNQEVDHSKITKKHLICSTKSCDFWSSEYEFGKDLNSVTNNLNIPENCLFGKI